MAGMDALAEETKLEVDAELEGREAALLRSTQVDMEALRPKVADQESYDKLIAAVNEAKQRNLTTAELKDKIESLGKGVMDIAAKVGPLLAAV
jgi:hypothetical protein